MRDIRKHTLEVSIGHQLGRAFRGLNRAMSAALRPHGLSAVQASILILLWEQGPLPVGELQKALGLSSSAFSGALDRMESQGLLKRTPAPSDGRSFLVEPASWSRARKQGVIDSLLDAEDELLAALDAKERKELLRLLVKTIDG
jgi:DNA-binding MarR family transcriptional regulator